MENRNYDQNLGLCLGILKNNDFETQKILKI